MATFKDDITLPGEKVTLLIGEHRISLSGAVKFERLREHEETECESLAMPGTIAPRPFRELCIVYERGRAIAFSPIGSLVGLPNADKSEWEAFEIRFDLRAATLKPEYMDI